MAVPAGRRTCGVLVSAPAGGENRGAEQRGRRQRRCVCHRRWAVQPVQGGDDRAEVEGVSEYSVARWRRYGQDRLYVTAADRTKVGWICLLTGQKQVEALEHCAGFDAAVADWKRAQDRAAPGGLPSPRHEPLDSSPSAAAFIPTSPPAARPSDVLDLAANRPGAAAREQALALRREAPVRTLVQRALGMRTEERAWRIGADGEELVGTQLAKLGPAWRHLHAVHVGDNGADVDHVVVGPAGTFTLNSKHHPGATVWIAGRNMRVNGRPVHYVRNSRHEATRAARLLTGASGRSVEATPILVFVGLKQLTVRDRPEGVLVCQARALPQVLGALPAVLSPQAIETIYAAARRSDTWTNP